MILMALSVVFGLYKDSSSSAEKIELWVDDNPGCEGYSPCYSSIQLAIDAAPTDGKTFIYILPGTYRENLTIQSKEIILRGSGAEVTMISAPNPTRPAILVSDLRELDFGFQDARIENFKISGGLVGIQIERAASATVSRNQIIMTGGAGLKIISSTRVHIEGNEFQGWDSRSPVQWQGLPAAIILSEGLGKVEIEDNYILRPNAPGIDIADGEDVTIRGNYIEGGRGVFVKKANSVSIQHNYIVAQLGILVWNPERAKIVQNTIQTFGSLSLGIGIDPQQGVGGGVIKPLIAHNLISGGGVGIGVSLTVFSDEKLLPEACPIIEYNTIQNAEVGIGIYAPPPEEYGRLVKPTIRYNLLQGNQKGLMAPPYLIPAGITWSQGGGSQLTVEGNGFEGNVIAVELGGRVQADLIGNYIFANTHGVSLGKSQVNFEGNRIIYNRGYGIAIAELCPGIRMSWEFEEGAYWGGEPEAIEGQDNEIHDNGQDLCPSDYPWPPGFVREEG